MNKSPQKSNSTTTANKSSKNSHLVTTVTVLIIITVPFVCMLYALLSGGKINTSTIRKDWKASPLANSSYFETEEITSMAEDDKIYFRVKGIDPLVIYVCQSSGGGLGRYCEVQVDGTPANEKQFGLSGYFWSLHRSEIQELLAKYENLDKWPSRWSDVQINVYNNDTESVTSFVRELLQIPDFQKLYSAYKEASKKFNSTDAYVVFGNYWLDFYADASKQSGKLNRYSLFEWAQEQGL